MKLLAVDGNFYLHRAWSVALYKRDPAYIERNVLTLFLTMIVSDVLALRATHVAVAFDAPDCWRLDLDPKYKEQRRVKKDPVMITHPKYDAPVKVTLTPGALVKPAKALVKAAGLKTFQKARMESDDLLGSIVAQYGPDIKIIVASRDKDMAGLVKDGVVQYWPIEKKLMAAKDIKAHYGVHPFQIRDFLSLMGDKVDNIPGVPGVAAKTAASMLGDDTLKNRLRKSAKLRERLAPHISTIAMAQKLTTLKIVELNAELSDLVPQPADKATLSQLVWAIPKGLDSFRDVAQAAKFKGLFSKIKR